MQQTKIKFNRGDNYFGHSIFSPLMLFEQDFTAIEQFVKKQLTEILKAVKPGSTDNDECFETIKSKCRSFVYEIGGLSTLIEAEEKVEKELHSQFNKKGNE